MESVKSLLPGPLLSRLVVPIRVSSVIFLENIDIVCKLYVLSYLTLIAHDFHYLLETIQLLSWIT